MKGSYTSRGKGQLFGPDPNGVASFSITPHFEWHFQFLWSLQKWICNCFFGLSPSRQIDCWSVLIVWLFPLPPPNPAGDDETRRVWLIQTAVTKFVYRQSEPNNIFFLLVKLKIHKIKNKSAKKWMKAISSFTDGKISGALPNCRSYLIFLDLST